MSLSERVRPDCEAAPWVVEEIKKLEKENKRLIEENTRFKEALAQIASGDVAQSSIDGYLDEAYQAIAKAALKGKSDEQD